MRVENINDYIFNIDSETALIIFISSDFIMCRDHYYLYIKKKFNSIKELKRQKKKTGEVSYIYKHGIYVFYLIISDYIENNIYNINIKKALNELNKHVTNLNINTIATSKDHINIISEYYENILEYMNEIFSNDITLYLYK
ncbi:hypothetical protein [Alphaentomopoxvirus acuprea]|uniref:Uncharacterized protein n=1 Tax=Alphaentomopoxvirus acuprea TaxID=62099 RepID=W6JLH9_9POXV|nr:hypothetical protein BA82_gp111 [Anomala cuprea entomopoxvirus]BAO49471.1 hypothetical protein [Anomala cuprea entomopoxvirus]